MIAITYPVAATITGPARPAITIKMWLCTGSVTIGVFPVMARTTPLRAAPPAKLATIATTTKTDATNTVPQQASVPAGTLPIIKDSTSHRHTRKTVMLTNAKCVMSTVLSVNQVRLSPTAIPARAPTG